MSDDASPLRNVTLAANRFMASPSARLLATICSCMTGVFLAGWWASSVWRDIQDLKVKVDAQGADIAAIRECLMPHSRPVISQNDAKGVGP